MKAEANQSMRTKFRWQTAAAWGLVLVLPALLGWTARQRDSEPPRIRVESALVTVPVVVSDAQGRFIPGLTAEAFQLYHDQQPEPVSLFLTSDDPIKIALLLDTSPSTMTVADGIKKAAGSFLRQLRPQDMAMVVSFDADIRVLCPLSSDVRQLDRAIRRAEAGGISSRLRDAVLETVERHFRAISGRKAIVLLSDGEDHGSQASEEELLEAVASSTTSVYPLFYRVDPRRLLKDLVGPSVRLPRAPGSQEVWRQREAAAAGFLEKLSELSGGRFYRSEITALDQAFKQISEELRSQYLLGFYPQPSKLDGGTHTLEVRVKVPDAVVRARRSYKSVRPAD